MKTKKTQSKSSNLSVGQKLKESSQLYLLMLPSIIIFLIFTYYPMYGVIIAFKDFKPALGIMGSKWVGMKNFITFFKSYQFFRDDQKYDHNQLVHNCGYIPIANHYGADGESDPLNEV